MSNYSLWGLFGPATWAWWLSAMSLGCLLLDRPGLRWGRRFGGAAVIVFLLFAVLPTGYWLAEPLEQRFPQIEPTGRDIRNIVVLAGAENLAASARSHRLEVGGAAERIFEGARLARLHPRASLWIVGGVRDPRSARADVDWTAAAWRDIGIEAARIRIVDGTLDTCSNAAGASVRKPAGTILLVTSALHMPRAVACFQANHVPVLPYPVDYQNEEKRSPGDYFSPALLSNIQRADAALHEWVGLVVYRATGRTDRLFPA